MKAFRALLGGTLGLMGILAASAQAYDTTYQNGSDSLKGYDTTYQNENDSLNGYDTTYQNGKDSLNGYDTTYQNGNGSSNGNATQWQGINLGIKAGATWSSFWGDGNSQFKEDFRGSPGVESFDPDQLVWPTGSIFLTIFLYDGSLAFQAEAQYRREGQNYTVDVGGTETELSLNIDYLAVPLLVKFYIPSKVFRPSLFVGPSLDIKLAAHADNVADFSDIPIDSISRGILNSFRDNEDISDNVNGMDVSIMAGLGFDIAAGPGFFVVEGRARLGLIDVFKDVVQSEDFRNWGFEVLAGYAFQF